MQGERANLNYAISSFGYDDFQSGLIIIIFKTKNISKKVGKNMRCPKCGALTGQDDKFCGICGASLKIPEIYTQIEQKQAYSRSITSAYVFNSDARLSIIPKGRV